MTQASELVYLPFIKSRRVPVLLGYEWLPCLSPQARFRDRVVAKPVLDLKQYRCRAVIDWLEICVSLGRPPGFEFWGGGSVSVFGLAIPVPVIIMLVCFAVFHVIATRTVYGRSVYCVGGNEAASRLSGLSVGRTRMLTFGLTGLLSAFVGVLLSSRIQAGSSNIGLGLEFEVIAAVIIGGTSLAGGTGSIVGTFLGVLFIGLLANGMILLGVSPFMQEIVRGLIILVAVFVSILQRATAAKGV